MVQLEDQQTGLRSDHDANLVAHLEPATGLEVLLLHEHAGHGFQPPQFRGVQALEYRQRLQALPRLLRQAVALPALAAARA
jgi:hypothetical protein